MNIDFIISLIVCIALHELGHLIAAKTVKCKVEIFSIGFGWCLFKKKIGETIYQLCLILLGGYCKLADEMNYSRKKYAFTNLSYSKKMFIILAGCGVNIIAGIMGLVLGKYIHNFSIWYFGFISLLLGISNLIPFPALDGSYIFLVLLEKKYGKKKGYALMAKIIHVGMILLMILNIVCIPLFIKLIIQ
jgi:membrane-associated protease RseP (regulator of RpoE activity)